MDTKNCCRCNDKSSCLQSSCFKAGRVCVSCLPLRRGHCWNAVKTSLHSANGPSVEEQPCTASSLSDSHDLHSLELTDSCSLCSSTGAAVQIAGDMSLLRAPLFSSEHVFVVASSDSSLFLPTQVQVADAAFTWGDQSLSG